VTSRKDHQTTSTSMVIKETKTMASLRRLTSLVHAFPCRTCRGPGVSSLMAVVVGMFLALASTAQAAAPAWHLQMTHQPGTFERLEEFGEYTVAYSVTVENSGDAPTTGTYTLIDTPPPQLAVKGVEPGPGWTCTTTEEVIAGAPLNCSSEAALAPGASAPAVSLEMMMSPSAPATLTNEGTISGGGGSMASATDQTPVVGRAPFAPEGFMAHSLDEGGNDYTIAGGHPYEAAASFLIPTYDNPEGKGPVQDIKDVFTEVPPGFLGGASALPRCELTGLVPAFPTCPPASQIGTLVLDTFGHPGFPTPVYNMVPEKGHPAEFAFKFINNAVVLYPQLRPRTGQYGVTVATPGAARINITGISLTLFGIPSLQNGVGGPEIPLLSNPVNCNEAQPITKLIVDSWQHPARQLPGPDFGPPNLADSLWKTAVSPAPAVTGCSDPALTSQFRPTIEAQPVQEGDTVQADQPAGLKVDLDFPQSNDPTDPNTVYDPATPQAPELKDATVKLPAGFSISPSAADGLAGCSDHASDPAGDQVHYDNTEPVTCPDPSKIGSVIGTSPLLAAHNPETDAVTGAEPIEGHVYLIKPHPGDLTPGGNQDGTYRLLIQLESAANGINVKLPGIAVADKSTGQLTATFVDNPQLPVKHLQLNLNSGKRAPLATPVTCENFTTTTRLVPWSTPGTPDATPSSSFEVNAGPNGSPCVTAPQQRPFAPALSAGTESAKAGASSPFVLKLTRNDGEQEFSSLDVNLPRGFTAKLAGVPYCSEAAIVTAATRSGASEQTNPTCPGSQVGTVTTGAGPGTNPYYVNGKAYLAGPYKGAPLSFVFITPAVAGPFDLGSVVVRAAAYVDPETAQVTVKTDAIPQILDGVPLRIRSIVAHVDRPSFTLNPTSCEAKSISATVSGASGAIAAPADHFQVGECRKLAFKPKLKLSLSGETKRSGNPALTAVLTQPPGQAGIAKTTVLLPSTEFIDNAHVNNPCTRVQFNANACPASSILGTATAYTPLLDQPLTGPVYFRSNGGERVLPDIVADLNGQIHVTLVGFVDSVGKKGSEKRRVRTRFVNVPDAPVSRFVLKMNGGKKGLIENSANLCKRLGQATVQTQGQNGKPNDFDVTIGTSCRKGKKK
jgi:hypothetical protein